MTFSELINEASPSVIEKRLQEYATDAGKLAKNLGQDSRVSKGTQEILGSGFKKDFKELETILEDARMAIEEIIMAVQAKNK